MASPNLVILGQVDEIHESLPLNLENTIHL